MPPFLRHRRRRRRRRRLSRFNSLSSTLMKFSPTLFLLAFYLLFLRTCRNFGRTCSRARAKQNFYRSARACPTAEREIYGDRSRQGVIAPTRRFTFASAAETFLPVPLAVPVIVPLERETPRCPSALSDKRVTRAKRTRLLTGAKGRQSRREAERRE